MKNRTFDPYSNPIWIMYECEKGNRFTAVKEVIVDLTTCNFSGCSGGHTTRMVEETTDRTTASNWFLNKNKEVKP